MQMVKRENKVRSLKEKWMMAKEDSNTVRPAVMKAFEGTRDEAAYTCQYMGNNANLRIMTRE